MPVKKCITKFASKKQKNAVHSSNSIKVRQHYCKNNEYHQFEHFALDILMIYWMTYYSNRSIKLFRCTFTQLQIKILAKKLEVKPLHYC